MDGYEQNPFGYICLSKQGPLAIKGKKIRFRNIAVLLHLWLGLLSGSIVFIIAITGCIYAFHDELQDLTRPWRKVAVENKVFIGPTAIFQKLSEEFPDAKAAMVIYQNRERPAHVTVQLESGLHNIYFNPYSGVIVHVQNLEQDFFLIVERLHRFLLLPEGVGKHITGIATIIFVFTVLTGMILWWPKQWKNAAQNFKIRWKSRWRRKNYDWHRATGFYILLPALIMAITGLSFSYEWMHESMYVVGNLGNAESKEELLPHKRFDLATTHPEALDTAFYRTMELVPDSGMLFVWDQGEGLPILTGAYPTTLAFDHQSNFYFHPQSGKLIYGQFYDQKAPGLQLQEMNYGLHTGQYFGLFGKIAAFICSLLVAALPITGFFIWRGRRKKKPSIYTPATFDGP